MGLRTTFFGLTLWGEATALAREASFVKREARDGKSVSISSAARDEMRFTRNARYAPLSRMNMRALCSQTRWAKLIRGPFTSTVPRTAWFHRGGDSTRCSVTR